MTAVSPHLHLESSQSTNSSSGEMRRRPNSLVEHSSHCRSTCASLVLLLLVLLHSHFGFQVPLLQLGSKIPIHVLLSHLRGFQVITRAVGTVRSSSLLPGALPIVLGCPWLVSSKTCLSFLSARVSVSQGSGGGEEPLVIQDKVAGCCFLVLLPGLERTMAGGGSKQPQTPSVSPRLSFLTPRALCVA